MKAKVYVTLKPSVLDPQGEAVAQALQRLGFSEVDGVRIGRFIELDLASKGEGGQQDHQRERLAQMCQRLLANPVIEDFRIEYDE